jgi:S-adenosylmethionine synthetase
MLSAKMIFIAGEVSTTGQIAYDKIARQVVCDTGYDGSDGGFDGNKVPVMISVGEQSPDIANGVNQAFEVRREGYASHDPAECLGAGDQGMVFGYACNETEVLMPLPIHLAHNLARKLTEVRKKNVLPYLRPDGKTQVSVLYENGEVVGVDTILISTQHTSQNGEHLPKSLAGDLLDNVVRPVLGKLWHPDIRLLVNPAGAFLLGGPTADTGLTGRKIIVDTYGGMARHGGGAFSGKDPTKVDRSGAYAARYVAKNIVAAELAEKCEIQIAYAIGMAHPVSIHLETFDTHKKPLHRIEAAVRKCFDLRPGAIIENLNLKQPIYAPVAAYGHFGREGLPWEKTDKSEELKELV